MPSWPSEKAWCANLWHKSFNEPEQLRRAIQEMLRAQELAPNDIAIKREIEAIEKMIDEVTEEMLESELEAVLADSDEEWESDS